jgi:ribonuclease E
LTRVLLLDVRDAEERRAALLEDGTLSLLWIEREDEASTVGNVYRGRVVRVEPSIGAAFVDLGLERPGFLPADDASLRAFVDEDPAADAAVPPPLPAAVGDLPASLADTVNVPAPVLEPRPVPVRRIEDLVRVGEDLVVQVARDAVARKGPTVTRHVSYAGRTLVLLPSLGRMAVSRKLGDGVLRRSVEERLRKLNLPEGTGIVARTASADAADEEMAEEAERLLSRHRKVVDAATAGKGPALLHAEDDFVTRAVRDLSIRAPEGATGPFEIVADTEEAVARAQEIVGRMTPRPEVRLHASRVPLFHAFGLERTVRALDDPRVPLPGGASIVIHETEAMWSIDVNSGRLRTGESLEATALATDLLAAKEAARQIRLRDLAGLVVVDFIDCREEENRAKVEEAFRAELAKDPARMRVAPLSEFMVSEITRRRMRSGPARTGSHTCPSCGGRGRIHSARSSGLAVLRDVRALLAEGAPRGVTVAAAAGVAGEMDRRHEEVAALAAEYGVEVQVHRATHLHGDRFEVRRR